MYMFNQNRNFACLVSLNHMKGYIQLKVTNLVYLSKEARAAVLNLQEVGTTRSFPLMIGSEEALSIAAHLGKVKIPVPLIHDLTHEIMTCCQAQLQRVVIHSMEQNILRTTLNVLHNDVPVTFSARTSDAIALALRFDKAIFINAELFENLIGKNTETHPTLSTSAITEKADLSIYTRQQIDDMLSACIDQEEYEKAILLRDELKQRNNNIGQ